MIFLVNEKAVQLNRYIFNESQLNGIVIFLFIYLENKQENLQSQLHEQNNNTSETNCKEGTMLQEVPPPNEGSSSKPVRSVKFHRIVVIYVLMVGTDGASC